MILNQDMDNRFPSSLGNNHCTQHKGEFLLRYVIQWRYSPTGLWPTERPPPVSEASANFYG